MSPTASEIEYRTAEASDIPGLLRFWAEAAENDTRPIDTADALRRLIDRDPDALIVAIDRRRDDTADEIVGTIIAGFDGWRAHLYRLAVLPTDRRQGIGRELLARAEARLEALGARRIDAMVLEANALGQSIWSASGYAPQSEWRRWVKPL